MGNAMFIETKRTVLRDFRVEDVDDLQEILGDEQVMEYLEPPYSRERTERFLRDFCMDGRNALAVEHLASGKMIGYVLFKAYGQPEVYEIAWIFNKGCWGNGYAYEACSSIMEYAFSHKINRFLFLGDYVGELAYPERIMELLFSYKEKYDCLSWFTMRCKRRYAGGRRADKRNNGHGGSFRNSLRSRELSLR